jgi:dolichol-phosphate mannosyltransferase
MPLNAVEQQKVAEDTRALIPGLSIVIPARNEAETIGETLELLVHYRHRWGLAWEIIVVDDHSIDDTSVVARRGLMSSDILTSRNTPGYGPAVTGGLARATRSRCTILAADGADDVLTLRTYTTGNGCVFADRWRPDSKVEGYPLLKRWANRFGNHLISRWPGRAAYTDWTDPFKSYPTAIVQRLLPLRTPGMAAGLELALRATQLAPITDVVPTTWRERRAGRSKFRLRAAWEYLDVVKEWA